MLEVKRQRWMCTSKSIAVGALLIAIAGPICRGAEPLPPEVQDVLDRISDTRAGMFDAFDSSTLGSTASPAEMAATQNNWRHYYMTPELELNLTHEQRAELGAQYGRVTLLGRSRCNKTFPLGITGVEVIDVEGRPELTVTAVDPKSSAGPTLQVGDVIIGANGRLFPQWEDPRVPMGYAIAAAQTHSFGGKLTLYVGRDGKIETVHIHLPVSNGYSATWPYDCERSGQITDAALKYVIVHGDDTFWRDLFLMAVGDANAIAHVRDNLRKTPVSNCVSSNWHAGYKLISLCEYYQLTHDGQVLPAIRGIAKGLEDNQMVCGGWSHGPPGGYGVMNQVGQVCFIGLMLARECGVEIDPEVLARGAGLSGRFIGTYGAYGDHEPWVAKYGSHAPNDNGKVPQHAVLFHLLGEDAVARRSARRACYQYRTQLGGHAELIFSIAWTCVGAVFASEHEQRMQRDNLLWYYELARKPDGSLNCLGHTRYRRTTAALGMVLTLPGKRLRICGAPLRTKPLFPIETLGPARPVHAPPATHDATSPPANTPDKWDTLIAATATGYRQVPADQIEPDQQKTWYRPSFDDGAWPLSKADLKTGNGVLLRKRFHCDQAEYSALRVTLPAGLGGELYLNGVRIAAFDTFRVGAGVSVQTLDLGPRSAAALRKGENLLAARLEGGGRNAVTIDLAAGPGMKENRAIAPSPPDYGSNNRNGWVGSYEQHRQNIAWFYKGKSASQIARYLSFPDWMGAQATSQALASRGDEAIPLLRGLVEDSHAGMRVGAWDTIAAMNSKGMLSDELKEEFSTIAAERIATEAPEVAAALGQAAASMATGADLGKILLAIAAKPDVKSRQFAVNSARSSLTDHPELMVKVLRTVAASGLDHSTIRVLGGAMGGMSRYPALPESREGVKEIARVLDTISPDMRGMFTDGLMHGGLAVIDEQMDSQLEKTPHLVAGLCKCYSKVPYTDWPGWAFANLYLRREIYRLSADSTGEIRRAVEQLKRSDPGKGEAVRRDLPMTELLRWADVLDRTKGDAQSLQNEALRLAGSNDPYDRLVALSLVWPSHRTLAGESGRYHGRRNLEDVARLQDSAVRLAVAARAASHVDTNRPEHWMMIWQTALTLQDHPQFRPMTPLLARFFDEAAYRQRGTFMFRAIDIAATVAQTQVGTPGETPVLARGLSKTWSTASNNGWYTGTRDKLESLVKKLGERSAPSMREAILAQREWLTDAPRDERSASIQTPIIASTLRIHFAEITGANGGKRNLSCPCLPIWEEARFSTGFRSMPTCGFRV